MQRLTVFLSSTVKDFAGVRSDLRRWFRRQGIVVRSSEDADFPVDDGVTSHDACLRAVDGCHLLVLLVGRRYGGKYAETPKSITWREYDEALERGIPVVALVLRDVNDEVERWTRGKLAEKPFTDVEGVAAFIDRVRKGHPDNWMHASWDGSFHEARRIIRHRFHSLFVGYQTGPRAEVRARAERLTAYAWARFDVETVAEALRASAASTDEKLDVLFGILAEHRNALFGFSSVDRWNLALYVPSEDPTSLRVAARRADARIERHDRRWAVGEGHVGLAWKEREVLVAADLTVTSAWTETHATDRQNYRSAIAAPVNVGGDSVGVFVVTSDRLDHFRDRDQPEVLTTGSVALFLIGRLFEERSEP